MTPKIILVLAVVLVLSGTVATQTLANVRIVEVDTSASTARLKNFGGTPANASTYWFCSLFRYANLGGLPIFEGSLFLDPGGEVLVGWSRINAVDRDLGLYRTSSFSSTTAMIDFVQWGSGGHGREFVAVAKGIWGFGDFVGGPSPYRYVGDGTQNGVGFWIANLPLQVEVLIKPGGFPNSINPNSRGVVPVAILGSEDFDVTDVDVTTLRFGPGNTAPAHNLTSAFTYNDHLQDVDLDGHMDLVSHYRIRRAGISCGDESATLTGETISGRAFEGSDTIHTVGCRLRSNLEIDRRGGVLIFGVRPAGE